ncbi:hypothetical protein ONZ45_g6630 [Pleurotus djamor]|nr:hypothetical protein ONZ45_g6630 [Pleurotus djamor]
MASNESDSTTPSAQTPILLDSVSLDQDDAAPTADADDGVDLAPLSMGGSLSSRYNNKLFPPIGTSWWRMDSYQVWKNKEVTGGTFITWEFDAYIYAVNARPDRKFRDNGGLVYIILAHRGFCYQWHLHEIKFWVKFPNDKLTLVKHFPVEDDYDEAPPRGRRHEPDPMRRTYPISFQQTMQMFRSNGNEPFSFDAGYEDSLSLEKGYVYRAVQEWDEWNGWMIKPDNNAEGKAQYPLTAVSVYRAERPRRMDMEFLLEAGSMVGPSRIKYAPAAL